MARKNKKALFEKKRFTKLTTLIIPQKEEVGND